MSEDLGFAVLAATPLPLLVTARDTKIVFGNVAAARLVGRPASSLPGTWLAEFVRSPHGRLRRLATVAAGAPHPVTAEVTLRVSRRHQIRIMVVVASLDRVPAPGAAPGSDPGVLLWQLSTAPAAHVLPDAVVTEGPADPVEADDEPDDGVALPPAPEGDLAAVAALFDAGSADPDVLAARAVDVLAGMSGVPHVRLFAEAGPHRGPVMAARGELAALVGQVEAQAPGGPTHLASAGRGVVVEDLEASDPVTAAWNGLATRLVADFGIRSLAVLPLALGEGRTGVVALYGEQAGEAAREADRVRGYAVVLGPVLGGALREVLARTEAAQLREAMASRAVIEQAKGVLMHRERLDADAAFERLRRESMVRNERLRDVATALVEEARTPPE